MDRHTDKQKDKKTGQMEDDPITGCLQQTFQANGIKTFICINLHNKV